MYKCRKCKGVTFDSAGSRDAHTRASHQKSCKVLQANGTTCTISKSISGEWACPYPSCSASLRRADRLQDHYKTSHIRVDDVILRDHVISLQESQSSSRELPRPAARFPETMYMSEEAYEEAYERNRQESGQVCDETCEVAHGEVGGDGGEELREEAREEGQEEARVVSQEGIREEPEEEAQQHDHQDEAREMVREEAQEEASEEAREGAQEETPIRSRDALDRSNIFDQIDLSVIQYEHMTLLVCTFCNVVLDCGQENRILNHVEKDLNTVRSSRVAEEHLLRQEAGFRHNLSMAIGSVHFTPMEEVKDFFYNQTGSVAPISGLSVQIGFSCLLCNYHVVSKRTMDTHKRQCHREVNDYHLLKSSLQRLVHGVGKKYFRVHSNQGDIGGNRDLRAALMKTIATINRSVESERDPPGRELSPFLRYTQWPKYAAELIPQNASFDNVKSTMLAGNEDSYSRIQDVIRSYAKLVREVTSKMDFRLRCLVRGPDPTEGFHQFLMESTVIKYCGVIEGFVLSLLRSTCDPSSILIYVVQAPAYLKEELWAFKRQLEMLGQDDIQPEGFDHTILHKLLLCLWTPPHDGKVQSTLSADNVFLQYMILHTLKRNRCGEVPSYSWAHVSEVTQMLSMLKFWARAPIEMELARNLWDPLRPEGMDNARAKHLLSYVDEDVSLLQSPFSYVSVMQKFACTIVGEQPVRPHLISKCPQNSWCTMNGDFISIDGFKDMVRKVIDECGCIMQEEVLQGLDTNWIQPLLEPGHHIKDDLNRTHEGYSFVSDEKNPFHEHVNDLFVHLFTRDMTKCHYICDYDRAGIRSWNKKALSLWMALCEKVADYLTLLLHWTSGQPPRGAEYGGFLIRNTATNHRNFFWSNETLTITQAYNKTLRCSKPVKHIVRFVPLCLRLLFLQYLCVVRPVEIFVVGLLQDGRGAALYRDCWFVSKGERRKQRQLGKSMTRQFLKHCNVSIRFSQYRHLAKFFCEPIRATCEALRLKEKALDASAGHSQRIAALRYAQNSEDMRFISRNQWKDFLLISQKWQEEKLKLPRDLKETAESSAGATRPAGVSTVHPCQELEVDFWSPPPRKRIRIAHACQSDRGASDDELEGIHTDAMHRAKLALTKLGHTEWKTHEQAIAVAMALDNVKDFVAILPTGSGKSVIFMAAAQNSGKTVVVVVPLLMLIKGHIAECKAANISCAEYRIPGGIGVQQAPAIVFVSVEIVILEHFREWAKLLIGWGTLHSIVIDEVHLMLCCFRDHQMSQLVLLSSFQCQIIGLTASLAPGDENPVRMRLGRPQMKVIRSATVRPNLEYGVVEATDMVSQTVSLLCTWTTTASRRERAMVYCMTKREVERLHGILQEHSLPTSLLHSSLEEADKVAQLHSWESGQTKIMVATGVIGCGYNYPQVRMVLHWGGFYALHDYHQQSGRCSRDGHLGICKVISNSKYREWALDKLTAMEGRTDKEINDFEQANQWITDKGVCRRFNLHKFLDGKAQVCVLLPGGVECDQCLQKGVTIGSQRQALGNGSRHWGPNFSCRGEEVNREEPTWLFVARPDAAQFDKDMCNDIADLNLVREIVGDGKQCLLCYDPPSSSEHIINYCGHASGKCIRCFSKHHRVEACNVKMPSSKHFEHQSCSKCFFQLDPIGEVAVHKWDPVNTRSCTDGLCGERIRQMIWHAYRDSETFRKLRVQFSHMPLEGSRLEEWLAAKEMHRKLNNFVRVGAAIIRMNHWEK